MLGAAPPPRGVQGTLRTPLGCGSVPLGSPTAPEHSIKPPALSGIQRRSGGQAEKGQVGWRREGTAELGSLTPAGSVS